MEATVNQILTKPLESLSDFTVNPRDQHPVIVLAALELLAGRVPAVGLPWATETFQEMFALDADADLDNPRFYSNPSHWARGAEETQADEGDPGALLTLLPKAILECVGRLCDIPKNTPYNLRLQQRVELAHFLELRDLVGDYLYAHKRLCENQAAQEPAVDPEFRLEPIYAALGAMGSFNGKIEDVELPCQILSEVAQSETATEKARDYIEAMRACLRKSGWTGDDYPRNVSEAQLAELKALVKGFVGVAPTGVLQHLVSANIAGAAFLCEVPFKRPANA